MPPINDGERGYGNLLFDICKELYNDGKRGRPKSVLPEGVKVKLKNKGSQKNKRGPKRQKYQTPVPEHLKTKQNIGNSDIHTNHCEWQNAALRRKNSTYRRKTNTYAKEKERLQITLDDYWIVHNFIRVRHTIKKIPAVAMGIIDTAIAGQEYYNLGDTDGDIKSNRSSAYYLKCNLIPNNTNKP
ncbi:MAG TPA: hypothetical protein QF753_05290 [Victivallales bacterium]|nr:hypothetical protein [Victivallales bacterium]